MSPLEILLTLLLIIVSILFLLSKAETKKLKKSLRMWSDSYDELQKRQERKT